MKDDSPLRVKGSGLTIDVAETPRTTILCGISARGRPLLSEVIVPCPKKENYAGGSTWMRVPRTVPLVDATT